MRCSRSRRHGSRTCWRARTVLEELDTGGYDLYAHQNEDIVRLTPEQLKQRMAAKERAAAG